MKRMFTALGAVALLISACQKEPSFEDPNSDPGGGTGGGGGGGTAPKGLLVRRVHATTSDSTINDFTYDAANRLRTLKIVYSQFDANIRLERNASGIITKMIIKSSEFASLGFDSVVSNVAYNTAAARYTSSVFSVTLTGFTYTDSTAFTYDAGGNLTVKTSYVKAGPAPFEPNMKNEYTYAGGNVTVDKLYSYDNGSWDHEATTTYTYDANVNPLKLGVEALLIGDPSFFGNNNAKVVDFVNVTDPTENTNTTYTFTYNAANKPSGGTALEKPRNVTYNLRFYYN